MLMTGDMLRKMAPENLMCSSRPPFFHFFHVFRFFFFSFFFFLFSFPPSPSPSRGPSSRGPRNIVFLAKILILRHESERRKKKEERKKKEKKREERERADRNRSRSTIARTGPFWQSRAWKPLTSIKIASCGTDAPHDSSRNPPGRHQKSTRSARWIVHSRGPRRACGSGFLWRRSASTSGGVCNSWRTRMRRHWYRRPCTARRFRSSGRRCRWRAIRTQSDVC